MHRIGRTGRVGNCGKATSFFDEVKDLKIAAGLCKILREANQELPNFLLNATDNADFNEKAHVYHLSRTPLAHGVVEE